MSALYDQIATKFKELAPGLRAPIVVFSDVGGNLEALEAVLIATQSAGVQQILCLGDSIGFGASPAQCLKRIKESVTIGLRGRLEQLLLGSISRGDSYESSLSERDARILAWTEQEVCPGARSGRFMGGGACEALDWLRSLPDQHRSGESYFCHQVKSEGLRWTLSLSDRVGALDGIDAGVDFLFLGANHRQWLVQAKNGASLADSVSSELRLQDAMTLVYSALVTTGEESSQAPNSIVELPLATKSIISVGSVGQPRDGDPRAAFAIFDQDRVYLCRVAYDVDAAMAKARGVSAFGEHGLARHSRGI